MQCTQCNTTIVSGDEREHLGRILCEDCYMDALSPVKTCDPWAVHSAKNFEAQAGGQAVTTELQERILMILKETGGAEPEMLLERLQIKEAELEREIATLRHMEKLRAELRDGRKVLRLW